MARAHYATYALDSEGRPIAGMTVEVRQPGVATLISQTVYDGDTPGGVDKGNPFTSEADGLVEIWLDTPEIVDLYCTKTGYDPVTIRATAHTLTANNYVVKDAGTPMTQRAGVNFTVGFTLTDDAVSDETEVAPNYAETADMPTGAAYGQANAAGTSNEIARADHSHELPADLATPHITDAVDAHDASAISVADAGGNFTATDVEAALAEEADARQAHEADAADAHDASAISVVDAGGYFAGTEVEAVLQELGAVITPSGAISAYGGSSAPSGWLLCDGTFVSQATYADLFAVLGHVFNGGTDPLDGTFKLPDLRGRFPLGKAAAGTGSTLGGTGGSLDHTHDAHSAHTASAAHGTHAASGVHDHGADTQTTSAADAGPASGGGGTPTDLTRIAHTHVFNVATGGDHSHDAHSAHTASSAHGTHAAANAPFQAVNYIVKT